MRLFVDVNVLLDVALARRPWSDEAVRMFDEAERRGVTLLVSAATLPTLFYVVRRQAGLAAAFDAIDRTVAAAEIADVTRAAVFAARSMRGSDFEDNLQIACAVEAGADAIVTRDPSGYNHSPIPACSTAEMLARLADAQ